MPTTLALNAFDVATVVGILLLNLFVGLAWSSRASKNTDEFYLAGRSLPWWLLGTSMVATTFALDTPLLIAELVQAGLYQNWIWLSLATSHLFVTFFLASRWRRSGATTDVELCEMRYDGKSASMLRAFKGIFFAFGLNCISLGLVFFAVGQICAGFGLSELKILGLPLPQMVLVGGLVVTMLYSMTAGLWGVVTTDAFQVVLALLGALMVAWLALGDPRVGGIDGLRRGLEEITIQRQVDGALEHMLRPTRAATGLVVPEQPGTPPLSWVPRGMSREPIPGARVEIAGWYMNDSGLQLVVFFLVMWWAWKFSDGGGIFIQRMLAAKDERHATYGMLWFCLGHYVLRWWPWALAGLGALLVFRDGELVASQTYARLVAEVVPIGLRGFIIAYFLAAFMSTVDTHLQLASSYFVNDVYRRFIKPEASQRHYVNVGRLMTLVAVAIAYFASLQGDSFKSIYKFILNLVAGAGVVFLLRWFWWRINAWSEISALASSLVIAGGLSLYNSYFAAPGAAVPWWLVVLINVGLSSVIWLSVTFLTAPTERAHLRAFYLKTLPWGRWAALREEGDPPPPSWGLPLACWIVAVSAIFGSLFGVRDLIAGRSGSAALLLGLGFVGAVWVLTRVPHFVRGAEPSAPAEALG